MISVMFGMVLGLSVKCLFGRPVTAKHVKNIHPMDRYVRTRQSRGVPLLSDEEINTHPAYAKSNV